VFLAGSTQAPEEEYALTLTSRLVAEHPQLRLIIVPRHKERFDEVAALIEESGLPWRRRTALAGEPSGDARGRGWRVLLVDAIGELGAWWGAANVGFVGGSFGARGGQNMLEPAAYGVPACFGPNTWNFRDIVARLLAADGARVVGDALELESFVLWALDEPEAAQALGERARLLVLSQQGATRRTVELLGALVDDRGAGAPRRAA
jgi:3-deoxy-D-manno-octulosonic-acid transferase